MSWISELRTSLRLDRATKPATGEAHGSDLDDSISELHQSLTLVSQPAFNTPDLLHTGIMRAVRATQVSAVPAKKEWSPLTRPLTLAGAAAALVLLAGGLVLLGHRPAPKNPAADLQQQLAQLPTTVVSPLSQELQSLQKDLEKTTSFLLASVPAIEN